MLRAASAQPVPPVTPPKRLRAGERIEVTIDKAVYRGQGLARHGGQVVFVPRAVPGDVVRARVQSVSAGYVRATPEVLVMPGPFRRTAPCPHALACGGCTYQGYDYEEQLRLKESVLRDALARAGVPWTGPLPVQGSPEQAWRTRAHLHLERGAGGLRVGFHQEGTHRVVPIEACLQLSEAMNRTALALRNALQDSPRFVERVAGFELAESFAGPGLVAALETDLPPAEASGLAALREAAPWLTGLGATLGGERPRRYLPLWGDPHVDATVAGFHFRAHVHAFFQGNRFLTEPLVRAVQDSVPPGGPVLDLYAGAGLFALPVAAQAPSVRTVEINAQSVADGRENIARAALGNVRYFESSVAAALASLPRESGERVILDPPRSGAGVDVVKAIADRRPETVVYVSCDPPTLGRDLKAFAGAGYTVRRLEAFDLFPDTFHLETLAVLAP
jgi:23S rRNA (uracil1939-C5)-methyltransferase